MSYRVRRATAKWRLYRLDRRLFPVDHPYKDPDAEWWEVVSNGRVVAFAAAKLVRGCDGSRTCYLTRVGVSRRHRGHGLQKRLIVAREKWAIANGCDQVVTYVSPENIPSLNSLIACGYTACKPGEAGYGDMTGFLTVRRDL